MNYLSVCSGIEAASVAWHPLGWQAVACSEIETFPGAVLAHHYPDTPNWGDMTRFEEWPDADVDVLVGGTPCQSFSVAGLRQGLDDPRGNLMLTYLAIARRYRPRWMVWENVPGVLSSNAGRDFGTFLGAASGQHIEPPPGGWRNTGIVAPGTPHAYGLAWRVLDAQFFGVPQRRRRVFVVGCLGGWGPAAAVLLEPESLRRDPPPRRQAGQRSAPTVAGGPPYSRTGNSRVETDALIPHISRAVTARAGDSLPCPSQEQLVDYGGNNTAGPIDVATAVNACATASGRQDFETETFVAHSLRGEGFDASEDGIGRGTPLVPVPFDPCQVTSKQNRSQPVPGGACHTLPADSRAPCVAFQSKASAANSMNHGPVAPTLDKGKGDGIAVYLSDRTPASAVRRLTPIECERLQGFPDGYTLVPDYATRIPKTLEADMLAYHRRHNPGLDEATARRWAAHPDGPRYRALGNSMAVPVMAWIGRRLAAVQALKAGR